MADVLGAFLATIKIRFQLEILTVRLLSGTYALLYVFYVV